MKRAAAALAGAALAVVAAAVATIAIGMRFVPDDPAVWHVDPATAARTGKPNDFLVAPAGATAAKPDRIAVTHLIPPRDLMFLFDSIAMNAARTHRIAGSVEGLWATYVQRSAFFGFPDYISVKAVPVPGGSALIVWSRARFGHGDFGVNRARVEDWLARIGGPSPG